MKLVELLARELKVWPEHATHAVQGDDGIARFTEGGKPGLRDEGYWSVLANAADEHSYWLNDELKAELATDHATAIVTRADWEAEVARLAAVKPEWIRHRGGKCPVEAGVLVDVRRRDAKVFEGEHAGSGRATMWGHHFKHEADIMAYRICEPEPKTYTLEWEEREPEQSQSETEHVSCRCIIKPKDDPRHIRDRIREIDITVEALEEERAGLVQQLEDEGFRLIGKAAVVVEAVVDMSDWRNWQAGDEVEYISSEYGNIYTKGNKYKVKSVEASCAYVFDNIGGVSACSIDDLDINLFRWHSRPSA